MPVIGFLQPGRRGSSASRGRAFRQGLKETGYVEGENVAIEYRWAEGQNDRLPALAAELVRRQSTVIVATGGGPFGARGQGGDLDDPDRLRHRRRPGQARSRRQPRPAGRQRDRASIFSSLSWRQSGWSCCANWCPAAARIAVLVNPANPTKPASTLRDVQDGCARHGAANLGLQRQHEPRNRRGLRNPRARAGRRPPRRPATHSSTAGASNLPHWRHAMRFPRSIDRVSMPKPAG